jgi:sulfatase maturation enzyme AslB (radical SAM superfamily)
VVCFQVFSHYTCIDLRGQVNELLSNGVSFPDHLIRKLGEANVHVMISLDGLEKDNDAQRIFPNGRGSFAKILGTFRRQNRMHEMPVEVFLCGRMSFAGIPDVRLLCRQNALLQDL